MTAGIIALVGIGMAVGLFIFSKKTSGKGRVVFKKTKKLANEIKGKFGQFVDQLADNMQGVLK